MSGAPRGRCVGEPSQSPEIRYEQQSADPYPFMLMQREPGRGLTSPPSAVPQPLEEGNIAAMLENAPTSLAPSSLSRHCEKLQKSMFGKRRVDCGRFSFLASLASL